MQGNIAGCAPCNTGIQLAHLPCASKIVPCAQDVPQIAPNPVHVTFLQGIGALSGGGGTSRLLFDYPEQQRGEILDALFTTQVKPALNCSTMRHRIHTATSWLGFVAILCAS